MSVSLVLGFLFEAIFNQVLRRGWIWAPAGYDYTTIPIFGLGRGGMMMAGDGVHPFDID